MRTVAILGGGGTGCAMAADNTLRGNSVRLWEDKRFYDENLSAIAHLGGMNLTGNATTGFAEIGMLTSDMAEAVAGAEVVMIAALTARHVDIIKELAPLLESGQTVCFSAGNCSSIALKNALPATLDVVVGEMSGNVFPCRISGEGEAFIALPYKAKPVAAFPSADTQRLVEGLAGVYECVSLTNVLEATILSPSIPIHLAGALLNTCAIDHNPDFRLYAEGLSKHVIQVMEEVELERLRVLKEMGYREVMQVPFVHQLAKQDAFPELDLFRSVAGPSSMAHRYVSEDAIFGQSLFLSLADTLGIEMPCTHALMVLAGVINKADYLSEGMTLTDLGMGGMHRDQINAYLQAGKV